MSRITASPDPCARGDTLKIHYEGDDTTQEIVTVTITDQEGHKTTVEIQLEGGAGTGHWDVPQDWGSAAFLSTPDGASTTVIIS